MLITITLLAFLVLLLVSLASLTRVETQVASNSQQLSQARQNALMALNIALGQLQKAAGPDQRVSATAEVLLGNTADPSKATHPTKKKWTGVWDTRPASWTAAPTAPIVWLVSQADPAVAPTNITAAPTQTDIDAGTAVRLVGSNTTDIDPAVPANVGNEVIVPVQDIKSSLVPGAAANTIVGRFGYWVGDEGVKARINLADPYAANVDTLSLLNRVGTAQRTAWELFSGSTSPTPAAIDPSTVITSAMTAQSGRMLGPQQIKLLAAMDASAPAGAPATLQKLATSRYHDYTLWSAGVQADVRNGGLKWDLSTAFDLSDPLFKTSEFADQSPPLTDVSQSTQKAESGYVSPVPGWMTVSGSSVTPYNVSFVFSPLVEYNNSGTKDKEYLRGPTWHLLRSHYLLYRAQTSLTAPTAVNAQAPYPSGNAAGINLGSQDAIPSIYAVSNGYANIKKDPNLNAKFSNTALNDGRFLPRPTQVGLVPYINRVFIRYGVRTVQRTVSTGPGSPIPASGSVYAVQLVMQPVIVLHNPYDKDLVLANYSGINYSFASGANSKVAGVIQTGATGTTTGLPFCIKTIINGVDRTTATGVVAPDAGTNAQVYAAFSYGSWPKFSLFIPPMTLKAGELKILYPQTGGNAVLMQPAGATPTLKNASDASRILMGITPNTQDGFIIPFLTNVAANNPNNLNLCSPLRTSMTPSTDMLKAVNSDENLDKTKPLPYPPLPGGAEVWCTDPSDKIKIILNSAGGDMEIKYGMEAKIGDDAYNSNCPLNYQISIYGPPFSSAKADTNDKDNKLAAYYDYYVSGNVRADNAQRPSAYSITAQSCSASAQFFFALDYYAKPADHLSTKATRPFITSNPVAFEQYGKAMGDQSISSGIGTSGFPMITPSYQVEFCDTYGPSLTDDIILDSSNSPMWGPTNGTNPDRSSTPRTSAQSWLDGSSPGLTALPLIHLPNRPLTSLAEFQHANITTYGYQPYFSTGNSYASPYVPANSAVNPVGYYGAKDNPYFLYDMSYWMNDALWDKYFFSSLSQELTGGVWASKDTDLLASIKTWANGTRTLPNSRMVPYNSSRMTAVDNLTKAPATVQSAYREAAASMLTLGSFNINSQSVDAWAAVLGAARNASVVANGGATATMSATSAVPRMTPATSTTQRDNNPLSAASWTGFAALTDAQIRQFAKNLVAEIKRRQAGTTYTHFGKIAGSSTPTNSYTGPFRSLSDFINRNLLHDLSSGATSTGAKGAIQAALDETSSPDSPNYKFYTGTTYTALGKGDAALAQSTSGWANQWASSTNPSSDYLAGQGPTASTASGFILQADVLQQIGPFLSARSDTFVIRTYGEAVNPATLQSTGKAWCEAVVQRLPEYVDQTDIRLKTVPSEGLAVQLWDATPPIRVDSKGNTFSVNPTNTTYGRRFKIISFRWLSLQDI